MKITDKHRSMIASAFVAAFDDDICGDECKARSLCCASDALQACARIVGKRKAERLQAFFYESLGCDGSGDPEHQESMEQHYLYKIINLETL